MSSAGLGRLRKLLTDRYDQLKTQVARRLGSSSDMAGDALHDAYVRLAGRDDFDEVQHPQTYLVNTAVNGAIDRIRSDARRASDTEIDELFELPCDDPGPDRLIDGQARMARMLQVLDALPPRRCALLIEYRVHGTATSELAERWGISRVMVRREIQAAHNACLEAMAKLEERGQ
jgi:RNA polymerase sigma factor (sigma-70 family)